MKRRDFLATLLAGPLLQVRSLSDQTNDLTALTIAEASRQLASRSITPLQLTNAYLARISSQNKALNAYITVTADLARREARTLGDRSKGALWGIPIAHKDLLETKGVRTTAGSRLFDNNVPANNAAIVQQFEDAGAVMLGKTNTHELGGGVTTINPFYGTTRNPIDELRIAGGSSGGSAAAVVARLCAAATGSDTGGSVRIPAAFCGCVGFKPTFGKFSTQGLIGSCPTFDHVGFLTRTVEDAQIMFRALGGAPADAALPAQIRVGVPTSYFFTLMEPTVEAAFGHAVAHMGSRGAHITKVVPPVDNTTMARLFDPIVSFEIWNRLGADWRINPGSFSKEFAVFFSTPRPSIAEYESALAALEEYRAAFDKLFDAVDVMVTPTVLVTAPPIAGPIDGMKILNNTWPFNAAGTPAISVPLKTSGLPVGLQLIARRGNDDLLLQVARTFTAP
jgi:aspartyl-tRNA(Asn)/glutamyl-tRNA(Gln) amidotransferase subunit A